LGLNNFITGVEQKKAPCSISVFCFTRPEAGLANQCCLLVTKVAADWD
jgi:hypothetical protein